MGDLLNLYKKAVFIRAFELRLAAAADAGHVPGLLHLCCGAELFEVALCGELAGPGDQVTGSHRSHGIALAMGVDPVRLAAEILGRAEGLSQGRGGTQHIMAPDTGFLTSNGIVGGQVPIAAGAALSAKLKNQGSIAVTFLGDGATNQGGVLETLNLAVALKLPLIFVIENNGLGQSTSVRYAAGANSISHRAAGFGLRTFSVDGYDAEDCLLKAAEVAGYVRREGLPAFVEATVPRLSGHYHGEKAAYQAVQETRDPLEELALLLDSGDAAQAFAAAEQEAHAAVNTALEMPEAQP